MITENNNFIDSGISNAVFCRRYYFTGGNLNKHLTLKHCGDIRDHVTQGFTTYKVQGITYEDLSNP